MPTLHELLQQQFTQPHWTRNQPAGTIKASVDDLTTDAIAAFDEWLTQWGYAGLLRLLREKK